MSAAPRSSRTRARQSNTVVVAKESEVTTSNEQEEQEESPPSGPDTIAIDGAEPSMQLLAEAAQNSARAPEGEDDAKEADDDDRSSSLSEIDDRGGTDGSEQPDNDSVALSEEDEDVDEEEEDEEDEEEEDDDEEEEEEQDADEVEEGNDTEAETERLESSPEKSRKQRKVLLRAVLEDNASSQAEPEADDDDARDLDEADDKADDDIERAEGADPPESSASTPAESVADQQISKTSPSRKRKRGLEDETAASLKKVSVELANRVADKLNDDGEDDLPEATELANDEMLVDAEAGSGDESQDEELAAMTTNGEAEDIAEAVESNVDEPDVDEPIQDDAANSARTEEDLRNKKAALERLSDIEKDFALLRDKLYADRNAQLNYELSTIQTENPTHPEYLAVLEAIDQLRNERIDHAKSVLRFKVQALQRKTVTTRATLQSQYMQRVRQLRNDHLEKASEEWYQIQRERRNFDVDEETPLNSFAGERSQLVAAQIAYNTEVSILSGIAKYVGFPAAPELRGVSTTEMDDDLRKMGISRHPDQLANSTVFAQIGRGKPGAEEKFIAETAWANPQHQQSQYLTNVHRQLSNSMASTSPVNTPAGQLRTADPVPNGSASTIPAVSSPFAPTPIRGEYQSAVSGKSKLAPQGDGIEATPSKSLDQYGAQPMLGVERRASETHPGQDMHMGNAAAIDAATSGPNVAPPSAAALQPAQSLTHAVASPMEQRASLPPRVQV